MEPDSLEPDPDVFLLNFPVWYIFLPGRNPPLPPFWPGNPGMRFPGGVNEKGEKSFLLFTDEHLAELYCEAQQIAGACVVPLSTEQEMLDMMIPAAHHDFTHFLIDARGGGDESNTQRHSFDKVRDAIRRQLGS